MVFVQLIGWNSLARSSVRFPLRPTLGAPDSEFQSVSDVIEMHEEPLLAIRQKKNSSLSLGIKFLRKRYLDGFVSPVTQEP